MQIFGFAILSVNGQKGKPLQSKSWRKQIAKLTKPNHLEYRSHALFTSLDRFMEFYEQLSDLIMGFLTPSIHELIINVDTYLYLSIRGTLNSIRMTVGEGHINDGYALVRKYYDLVMLSIYLDQYLKDRSDEEAIAVDWVKNWLRDKKPLPSYKVMCDYVVGATQLEPVIGMLLNTDDRYKAIRDRSNAHMHYCNFHSILLNDKDIYIDRMTFLDRLKSDVADLFVLHLTCVFFTNEHYMMSSDYMDCLECGMTPNADSLYWVAPFVQNIFDEGLNKRRPDVCAVIKKHTLMHLR